MTEEIKRCPYELFVEKYFKLPSTTTFETVTQVELSEFVNILAMFDAAKSSSIQSRIKEPEQENSLMKEALQGTENTYFYEEIRKRDTEIERLKAQIYTNNL